MTQSSPAVKQKSSAGVAQTACIAPLWCLASNTACMPDSAKTTTIPSPYPAHTSPASRTYSSAVTKPPGLR
ncbi:hypothetical protein DIPPA_01210 [Diplonema papillatum]|nr:hypothetical protein DIPPA_01210 [Diplonema papillatum]